MAVLRELDIAGDPPPWEALGFAVRDDAVRIGEVGLRLGGGSGGLTGWGLEGERVRGDIDGVATRRVPPGSSDHGVRHPNGARRLDHVVLATPDLTRTLGALASAGIELRRTREAGEMRQAFHRLGETILEVVGPAEPPPGDSREDPARLWGLVVVVPDVDSLADRLGKCLLGRPKDAVQRGRRIATVRPAAGVGVPLAFMTPDPERG